MMKVNAVSIFILRSTTVLLLLILFSSLSIGEAKTTLPSRLDRTFADSTIHEKKGETQLQERLDTIQLKLENIEIPEMDIKAEIIKKKDQLISKIMQLRAYLSRPKAFTQIQLKKVQQDVKQLSFFVTKLCSDLELLKSNAKELEELKAKHNNS